MDFVLFSTSLISNVAPIVKGITEKCLKAFLSTDGKKDFAEFVTGNSKLK